jgi:hypothetical protein
MSRMLGNVCSTSIRDVAQTSQMRKYRSFRRRGEWVKSWLETFENEVASFPNCKFADQVDSMVQFLYAFDRRVSFVLNLTAYRDHREQPF